MLNEQRNFTYFDAMMATTSAPTFFKAHKIEGLGIFYDGGLQANNPSELVYKEYMNYYKQNYEKLFIFSLGTGYANLEGLNPAESGQGNLFWARNLVNYTLPAIEGKIEENMFTILNNNYQKWQVHFPANKNFILDNTSQEILEDMMHLACDYVEELKNSEDNSFNKLIEFLLEDKLNYLD